MLVNLQGIHEPSSYAEQNNQIYMPTNENAGNSAITDMEIQLIHTRSVMVSYPVNTRLLAGQSGSAGLK